MNPGTILLRQVHPSFVQDGRISSQVFRPTPKDEALLSVDNGDLISAEAAFQRFINWPECRSSGVMGVTCDECDQRSLPVLEDGAPHPEHCSIDFSALSKSQVEKAAKYLKHQAQVRGWLHRAS